MSKTVELNWFPVEVDSMPSNVRTAYGKLVKAQAEAKKAKDDFEAAFTQAAKKAERIEEDVVLAFSYKFGNVAIARRPKGTTAKANAKPKFSF